LKTSEQARTKVLQELAHDLRTPLASLRNLVDTLQSSMERLDKDTRNELLNLSTKEIDYFERLVEDLLFLAQLKEPDYVDHRSTFNLPETVLDVAEDCLFMSSQKGKKLELVENLKDQKQDFAGDQHPIKRLVRNAVENACSFARSKVTVTLENADNRMIRLIIADDGPGFKADDLNSFGQRNISRKLNTDVNGRVSLGLGSVVIKTICDVYHGNVSIQNIKDSSGAVLGAEIRIELPNNLYS
jgi:K+-sensing histidine kinase KdpD